MFKRLIAKHNIKFVVMDSKMKITHRSFIGDNVFDIAILGTLSFLFSGTLGGLTIAMVSSFAVSIYLYFFPPDISKIFSFYNFKLKKTIK